jgi:hypothetical protein
LAGLPVWDVHHEYGAVDRWLLNRDDGAVSAFDADDRLAGVPALAEVAESVSYWGGYSAADPLEVSAVLTAIRPQAEMLAAAPGCQWWWSGIDRSSQGYVQWTLRSEPGLDACPVLRPGGAAAMLRDVAREAAENERTSARYLRRPPGSGPGGVWWTVPYPGALSTTRRLGQLGSLLLAGREDGYGDTEAVIWPVVIADTARVLEIDGPAVWQNLVTAYPRAATASYRHVWHWTGWDGEWLLPDWPSVARDWDGVHLTVAGYLATAGRPLPVAQASTMLAGWDPDETFWLADVISDAGEPQRWRTDEGTPLTWYQY